MSALPPEHAAETDTPTPEPLEGLASLGLGLWRRGLPLGVFLLALTVYRLTLMPGVGLSDTAEFQSVPYLLGIAHPTGYPTYTLLGKLACAWPEGAIAFRLNLFAALCGALGALGATALARKLGAGVLPACAAGLALAFSEPYWENALSAEPHMLHLAFVTGLLLLALRWRDTGRVRGLAALAALVGLALGNHMQTVMLVPVLALWVLLARPRTFVQPRALLSAIGAGLAGLSVFAYLPLRAMQNPPINYAHPSTWERFKYVVLGEQFKTDMSFLSPDALVNFPFRFGRLLPQVAEWLTPVGAAMAGVLALAGLVAIARRDWRAAVFLAAAWLVPLYTALNYANDDLRRYFFTSLMLTLVLAGVGLQSLIAALYRALCLRYAGRVAGTACLALATLSALCPLGLVPANWSRADNSHSRDGEVAISRAFTAMKPNPVVIAWWTLSTAFWYGRYVEERRTDVKVVDDRNLFDDGWGSVTAVVDAYFGKRPVYVVRFEGDIRAIAQKYVLKPVTTLPPYQQPLYEVVARK